MKDNILIDDTIKIFENGVTEISKLKRAVINLNDKVRELTEFEEIIDLDINASKIQVINDKLYGTIEKYKEVLSLLEESVLKINEENKNKTKKIETSIVEFYNEVERINKDLNSFDFSVNNNIINNLFKDLRVFIKDIENKCNKIDEKYNKIEKVSSLFNGVKDTIQSNKLDEQITNTLNKMNQLDLKFNKINESIENFQNNINNINNNFQNYNVLERGDEILKNLDDLKENIDNEYEIISLKYKEIDKLKEEINDNNEEKIKRLEEKMDLVINENKALRLAYSTREIEDNNFKDEILNLIKESLSTISSYNIQDDNIEKLKQLSKKGDVNASFKLGEDYYLGNKVNKNVDLAVKYYKIGAKVNHSKSIEKLLNIYIEEATNGNVKYQRILGNTYLKGEFVESNMDEAIKWFTKASENGSLEAKQKLKKINDNN